MESVIYGVRLSLDFKRTERHTGCLLFIALPFLADGCPHAINKQTERRFIGEEEEGGCLRVGVTGRLRRGGAEQTGEVQLRINNMKIINRLLSERLALPSAACLSVFI
ncbi:hypothetical protein EYF80_012082 [Liparis tanakae]|uniref:Uncharacterized protein n=1 Tax=Liparis tanakae TaxID=230148 RepID=A0A4Z2IJY5_9TELE|nr:hypothetical protein EYF80_012082 [Liparis tanakae]